MKFGKLLFALTLSVFLLTGKGTAQDADQPATPETTEAAGEAREPAPAAAPAEVPPPRDRRVRIKDITMVEGIRDNPLIGYGMVVGLNGTGDRRQTIFSTQTLANILQRMGIQIPPEAVRVKNIAAVFVTATLPPFARPGLRIDVTVSSVGDAKSLEGGLLLMTPLYGSDGQPYVAAQGSIILGGFSASGGGNSIQVNHPTVGRIPSGGIVERDASLDLEQLTQVSFLLRDPDFALTRDIALLINEDLGLNLARAVDSRRVELVSLDSFPGPLPTLLARVENLSIEVPTFAKVVINERTGTVVMGKNVRLGAVSILHGNLVIEIATEFQVSQPTPFAPEGAETVVVPQTEIRAEEMAARRVELDQGSTVEDLVRGLQAIGATPRDIVAILQAIKAAGALQAELVVL